ncbi:MAG TPA: hypothetical protein VM600_06690 [Actinomycetota bacterium]|nr:hypothetical protein [Actinomycetota bacterium]
MKRALVPLLAAVLAACSAKTPIAVPSSPETASPSPSVSPTATATPMPRARRAVVAADGAISLYDVRADTVTELARGEGIRLPRFANRNEVSFVQDAGEGAVLRLLNVSTRAVRDVLTVTTGIRAYDWSPDRGSVAYVTVDSDGYPQVEIRDLAGDQSTFTMATLARARGRGRTISDQERVEFSADGRFLLIVFTPADGDPKEDIGVEQSQLQVRALDGTLAFSEPNHREPTQGLWSFDATQVFYRSDRGTRLWRTSNVDSTPIKGRGAWFNPWASPDGRTVVYDSGATDENVEVRTVNVRNGARTTVSEAGYFHPVAADRRTVWVQRATVCEPDCLEPVVAAPEVLAIDLVNGKKRKLTLRSIVDIDVFYS